MSVIPVNNESLSLLNYYYDYGPQGDARNSILDGITTPVIDSVKENLKLMDEELFISEMSQKLETPLKDHRLNKLARDDIKTHFISQLFSLINSQCTSNEVKKICLLGNKVDDSYSWARILQFTLSQIKSFSYSLLPRRKKGDIPEILGIMIFLFKRRDMAFPYYYDIMLPIKNAGVNDFVEAVQTLIDVGGNVNEIPEYVPLEQYTQNLMRRFVYNYADVELLKANVKGRVDRLEHINKGKVEDLTAAIDAASKIQKLASVRELASGLGPDFPKVLVLLTSEYHDRPSYKTCVQIEEELRPKKEETQPKRRKLDSQSWGTTIVSSIRGLYERVNKLFWDTFV